MRNNDSQGSDRKFDSLSWHIHRDRFLFDARTGHFFAISPEGAFILRDLASGLDVEAVENNLVARYGIDHGAAMRDVEHFRGRLRTLGIDRGGSGI